MWTAVVTLLSVPVREEYICTLAAVEVKESHTVYLPLFSNVSISEGGLICPNLCICFSRVNVCTLQL